MALPAMSSTQSEALHRKVLEELRHELEATVSLGSSALPAPANPFDKVAAAAVQCYSTFAVLATFLAGLQAGLLSMLSGPNVHPTVSAVSLSIATAALLLQILVVILSTMISLLLTIDKILVAVSAGAPTSLPDQQPFLLLVHQVVALKPLSSRSSKKPSPVADATRIIERMRGSFWDLGIVLIVRLNHHWLSGIVSLLTGKLQFSATLTLIDVILWAWITLPSGVTASVVTSFSVILLARIVYNLVKTSMIDRQGKKLILGLQNSKSSEV